MTTVTTLSTKDVAALTGLSTRTLEGWRRSRNPAHPVWIRCPITGGVAYPAAALAEWMARQPRLDPLLTLAERTLLEPETGYQPSPSPHQPSTP